MVLQPLDLFHKGVYGITTPQFALHRCLWYYNPSVCSTKVSMVLQPLRLLHTGVYGVTTPQFAPHRCLWCYNSTICSTQVSMVLRLLDSTQMSMVLQLHDLFHTGVHGVRIVYGCFDGVTKIPVYSEFHGILTVQREEHIPAFHAPPVLKQTCIAAGVTKCA